MEQRSLKQRLRKSRRRDAFALRKPLRVFWTELRHRRVSPIWSRNSLNADSTERARRNRLQVDSAGKMHGSHGLVIFGPDAFQCLRRQFTRLRPHRFVAFQMRAAENPRGRVLARSDATDSYLKVVQFAHPAPALARLCPDLAGSLEKQKCRAWLLSLYSPDSQLNKGQRIAAARLQNVVIEMKLQPGSLGNLAQSRPVALFALPLASQIDASTLLNAQPAHPMRGTAPYTPPRYFW